MSFQSLNPELTARVIFLANLQRNIVRDKFRYAVNRMRFVQMQNQNATNEKTAEENTTAPTVTGQQQQFVHPLLMPSLVRHFL